MQVKTTMTWRRVDSLVAALNVIVQDAGEGEGPPVSNFAEHPVLFTNISNPVEQVPLEHPAIPEASHTVHDSTDAASSASQAVHPV
jgi:hypothetical protein